LPSPRLGNRARAVPGRARGSTGGPQTCSNSSGHHTEQTLKHDADEPARAAAGTAPIGKVVRTTVEGRSSGSDGRLRVVTEREMLEWDMADLVALAATAPAKRVEVSSLSAVNKDVWFARTGRTPTLRALAAEFRQVWAADPDQPLLAVAGLGLIDGMHRLVRAMVDGRSHVALVTLSLTDLLALPHARTARR